MLETAAHKFNFQSNISYKLQKPYINSHKQPRILIVSMRGFQSEAFRSAEYEFEDVINTFDYADLLSPAYASSFKSEITKKIANYAGLALNNNKLLAPGCKNLVIIKEYDLFFFIFKLFWD